MTKMILSVNLEQKGFQMSCRIVPGILGSTLSVLIIKEAYINSENNHGLHKTCYYISEKIPK